MTKTVDFTGNNLTFIILIGTPYIIYIFIDSGHLQTKEARIKMILVIWSLIRANLVKVKEYLFVRNSFNNNFNCTKFDQLMLESFCALFYCLCDCILNIDHTTSINFSSSALIWDLIITYLLLYLKNY